MTDKAIRMAAWKHYGVLLSGLYVELVRAGKMRLGEAVREYLTEPYPARVEVKH